MRVAYLFEESGLGKWIMDHGSRGWVLSGYRRGLFVIPVRREWVRCLARRPLDEAHTRAIQRQIEPNGQKQGEMRIGQGYG